MQLYAPSSYKSASLRQIKDICNGCGAKGFGGWLVPDTMWGLDIREACQIHDWMYHEGDTIEDKEEADRVFLNNCVRVIEAKSVAILKPLRRRRALKYYEAVTTFGGDAFWADKNTADEMIDEADFSYLQRFWGYDYD